MMRPKTFLLTLLLVTGSFLIPVRAQLGEYLSANGDFRLNPPDTLQYFGVELSMKGDEFYVYDYYAGKMYVFDLQGKFITMLTEERKRLDWQSELWLNANLNPRSPNHSALAEFSKGGRTGNSFLFIGSGPHAYFYDSTGNFNRATGLRARPRLDGQRYTSSMLYKLLNPIISEEEVWSPLTIDKIGVMEMPDSAQTLYVAQYRVVRKEEGECDLEFVKFVSFSETTYPTIPTFARPALNWYLAKSESEGWIFAAHHNSWRIQLLDTRTGLRKTFGQPPQGYAEQANYPELPYHSPKGKFKDPAFRADMWLNLFWRDSCLMTHMLMADIFVDDEAGRIYRVFRPAMEYGEGWSKDPDDRQSEMYRAMYAQPRGVQVYDLQNFNLLGEYMLPPSTLPLGAADGALFAWRRPDLKDNSPPVITRLEFGDTPPTEENPMPELEMPEFVPDTSLSFGDFLSQAAQPKEEVWVVDLWAYWCGPCMKGIPKFRALYEKYSDKGVRFIGMSTDPKQEQWMHAVRRMRMEWTQVCVPDRAGHQRLQEQFPFGYIPTYYIIDREGQIRKVGVGPDTDLESAIQKALKK